MIKNIMWDKYITPMYLFLIKLIPLIGVIFLVFLLILWFRFVRNKIFDILHPETDIQSMNTNTWYKTPEQRAKLISDDEKNNMEGEKGDG